MINRGIERRYIHDKEEICVRGQEGKGIEKMESVVDVLDVSRKAANKRLQNTIKEIRDVFSRARASRNNRATRIVRFVDLGK
jgi:hypothetical protein